MVFIIQLSTANAVFSEQQRSLPSASLYFRSVAACHLVRMWPRFSPQIGGHFNTTIYLRVSILKNVWILICRNFEAQCLLWVIICDIWWKGRIQLHVSINLSYNCFTCRNNVTPTKKQLYAWAYGQVFVHIDVNCLEGEGSSASPNNTILSPIHKVHRL